MPHCPLTEDADMLSATNSEVESAMNHQRRWVILCITSFPKRHLMLSIRETHISELLKVGLPERWTSIPKIYR